MARWIGRIPLRAAYPSFALFVFVLIFVYYFNILVNKNKNETGNGQRIYVDKWLPLWNATYLAIHECLSMIPLTYQVMKRHVCAECGEFFESGSPQARYCTLTCQRTAKSKRRALRDAKIHHEQIVASESRFFTEVENPTIPQLSTYADMVAKELTNDKPIRFYGIVPMWSAPDGVIFSQQQKLREGDPNEWLMFHPSMIE